MYVIRFKDDTFIWYIENKDENVIKSNKRGTFRERKRERKREERDRAIHTI